MYQPYYDNNKVVTLPPCIAECLPLPLQVLTLLGKAASAMAMGMPYCQCVNAFEREVQNWPVGRGVACCTWKGLVPCLCNSSGIISSCNENKSNAMRVTVRILIHMSGKFPPNLTFLLLEGIFTLPRTEWKSPCICQVGKLMIAQHISDCAYLNP